MKIKNIFKKLRLNKETIANLSNDEMEQVKAGHDQTGCWENLWTAYEYDVVYTGPAEPLPQVTVGDFTCHINSQCTI